jgi:hypothetical protein
MREIRSSGLEGGVEFDPPSLPLSFSTPRPPRAPPFLFFSGAPWNVFHQLSIADPRAAEKTKGKVLAVIKTLNRLRHLRQYWYS